MSRTIVKQVGIGIVLSEFLDESGIGGFKVASIVPESGADICRSVIRYSFCVSVSADVRLCRTRQVAIGDVILAVDCVKVGGKSLIEVAKLFSGPSGTSIAVKIKRWIPGDSDAEALPNNLCLNQTQRHDESRSLSCDSSLPALSHDKTTQGCESQVRYRTLTVNVTRIDFSSDDERYVSWIRAAEAERAAAGMGGWLLDRMAPRGSEMMRLWGAQLRDHMQRTQMVDTISAQARSLITSKLLSK